MSKIEQLPVSGCHPVDGDRLRFACYIKEFKALHAVGDTKNAEKFLAEIIDYIVDAFSDQERMMTRIHDERSNYLEFGNHLREHANFFVSLREARSLGNLEAVEFIERWFINHTINFDIDLGRFIKTVSPHNQASCGQFYK